MKKFLMTIAAVAATMSVNAQVYVGGALGLQSVSHDGESVTTYAILPEVGYVLDDNWALGVSLGYSKGTSNDVDVKVVTVNPYARYTFAKFDKVNLFVDGGFGYSNADLDAYKVNTWNVGLKPGVAVNLNEKVSFVAHLGFLGYESSKADNDGAKAYNTFGLGVDATTVNFGFYYNF